MAERAGGGERRWALEEFGGVELGDERRRARLVRMAARAAQSPSGRVTDVFASGAERQGAYDFLESPHVHADALVAAMRRASVERCRSFPFAFVPVDGSSVTLVDRTREKDFGSVGSYARGARGLKVIDAIAVSPRGVPLGVCAMQWWTRPRLKPTTPRPAYRRKVSEKETHHWLDAIDNVARAFKAAGPTRAWFQLDREGDTWSILRRLSESGEWFTVRSNNNRRLRTTEGPRRYVHDAHARAEPRGSLVVDVEANPHRRARKARLELRTAPVLLDLLNTRSKSRRRQLVNVVFVQEVGTTPRGEAPLCWTLLTNRPVETVADAKLVVTGYTYRWRIEEHHRAWKSGVCGVETMQLRSRSAASTWATLLAAVAQRAERLKQLAREQPDQPATIELSPTEIDALRILKEEQKSRVEVLPDRTPTIGEAVRWIADLGGYTGKSSGGPPGATTIGRGLEKVLIATAVLEQLKSRRKKR